MAESLTPWISDYLVTVAETCGANLSTAKPHEKKKKVQIIEFLTFGSESEDTHIWARVSDKQYIVPIKFTKEAVVGYSALNKRRLTQHKTAIITVQNFRPIFTRLPLGDKQRMTDSSYLAIECHTLSILGSSGEAIFGSPKPITSHVDLHLWSEGLKLDGGAGNVLKERKAQQKANTIMELQPQIPLPAQPPAAEIHTTHRLPTIKHINIEEVSLSAYMTKWQFVDKNVSYRRPPLEPSSDVMHGLEAKPIQLSAPPESPLPETQVLHNTRREQSRDPSVKSLIDTSDVHPRSGPVLAEWEPTSSNGKVSPNSPLHPKSSSLPAPTPAQRAKPASLETVAPSQESLYPPGNETVFEDAPPPSPSQNLDIPPTVPRKIPRPTFPKSPKHQIGPARILAPNSDTSGTQSQSQSIQSQPQSQSRIGKRVSDSSPRKLVTVSHAIHNETEKVRTDGEGKSDRSRASYEAANSSPASPVLDRSGQSDSEAEGMETMSSEVGYISSDESERFKGFIDMNMDLEDGEYPWIDIQRVREILEKSLRNG
ncbi:hypothetical protein B0H34DRAFT_699122 [Crassisporium funariophilum]|nr:hypothetical protein B0H34DRAFT_699122 [Crassisporium funariophilum]